MSTFRGITCGILIGLIGYVVTATIGSQIAIAAVSQGFAVTSPIANGSLVSLNDKKTGAVDLASIENSQRLIGVVVPASSSTISIGSDATGQVQVSTSGSALLYVSNANGSIEVGDRITTSSIAGVGQKAVLPGRIIGTAQSSLNDQTAGVSKQQIVIDGVKKEVVIGQVSVVIDVGDFSPNDGTTFTVPSWLQVFSNTIAGRTVSPTRIVVAGAILLVTIISVSVLLYGSVRNSIISIGRNPLSKKPLFRGLIQVVLICVFIMAIAVAAVYWLIAK